VKTINLSNFGDSASENITLIYSPPIIFTQKRYSKKQLYLLSIISFVCSHIYVRGHASINKTMIKRTAKASRFEVLCGGVAAQFSLCHLCTWRQCNCALLYMMMFFIYIYVSALINLHIYSWDT
jgi:hypothetical protein